MIKPHFSDRLKDPNPGFLCSPAGNLDRSKTFLAEVHHRTAPPASPAALQLLSRLIPTTGSSVSDVYRAYNGLTLFADHLSEAAALTLFPVEQWEQATSAMREWWDEQDLEDQALESWQINGLAIGEVPQSGNYLVIDPTDPLTEQIFYQDHDDFREMPIAMNLEDLLNLASINPVDFIMKCGCYARYSDGVTDTQWIPMKYIADTRRPQPGH